MLYVNAGLSLVTPSLLEQALAALPPWRRQAALRFKHHRGRVECAMAYLELCRGLRAEYGIEESPAFAYQEGGKPWLKDFPHIHFSLSHCKAAAGCLLSHAPCGLDIESLHPAGEDLVRYTMNPRECEAIFSSARPDLAFTRLWTQKEALLKLLGTGVTDELRQALSLAAARGIRLHTTEHEGYVVSTATMGE